MTFGYPRNGPRGGGTVRRPEGTMSRPLHEKKKKRTNPARRPWERVRLKDRREKQHNSRIDRRPKLVSLGALREEQQQNNGGEGKKEKKKGDNASEGTDGWREAVLGEKQDSH